MTYNYPFFSFPHFRRYPTYSAYYPVRYPYTKQGYRVNYGEKRLENHFNEKVEEQNKSHANQRINENHFSFLNNVLHQEDRDDGEEHFELFGLKLYNDDLLLIGLIFFLYKEDVKDQYLFFALILLLLS